MPPDAACEVFTTYCESHTRDVPFHVVARLLRARHSGIERPRRRVARACCAPALPDAECEDLLLLDDLLGISGPRGRVARHRARCPAASAWRDAQRGRAGAHHAGALRH